MFDSDTTTPAAAGTCESPRDPQLAKGLPAQLVSDVKAIAELAEAAGIERNEMETIFRREIDEALGEPDAEGRRTIAGAQYDEASESDEVDLEHDGVFTRARRGEFNPPVSLPLSLKKYFMRDLEKHLETVGGHVEKGKFRNSRLRSDIWDLLTAAELAIIGIDDVDAIPLRDRIQIIRDECDMYLGMVDDSRPNRGKATAIWADSTSAKRLSADQVEALIDETIREDALRSRRDATAGLRVIARLAADLCV